MNSRQNKALLATAAFTLRFRARPNLGVRRVARISPRRLRQS